MEMHSAAEALHHHKGCELTRDLYYTHRSGESGEKALLQIPSPQVEKLCRWMW